MLIQVWLQSNRQTRVCTDRHFENNILGFMQAHESPGEKCVMKMKEKTTIM